MTTENLTEEQREEIIRIARRLESAFSWTRTEEGYHYWEKVYDALVRIANSNPEEVEKEIELNGRKYRLVEE